MYVGEGKTSPEGCVCSCCQAIFKTIFVSSRCRLVYTKYVGLLNDFKCEFGVSGRAWECVLQTFCWCLTFGACTIFSTCYQALLLVISSIGCQDWVDPPLVPISTIHVHPLFPCLH